MISSTSTINRTKFLALPYFKTFNIIAYEYECTSKYLFSPDGSFKVSDLTLKLPGTVSGRVAKAKNFIHI